MAVQGDAGTWNSVAAFIGFIGPTISDAFVESCGRKSRRDASATGELRRQFAPRIMGRTIGTQKARRCRPTAPAQLGWLVDAEAALHFFQRVAFGFWVDEEDYEKLDYHHGGEKYEGVGAGGFGH